LRIQAGWIGWPLFSAVLTGSVMGMGLGVVDANRPLLTDAAPLRVMERWLGRWSAMAWACALLMGVFPVARYWLHSGGVSVFGEL
jgi:hypothetical protein